MGLLEDINSVLLFNGRKISCRIESSDEEVGIIKAKSASYLNLVEIHCIY